MELQTNNSHLIEVPAPKKRHSVETKLELIEFIKKNSRKPERHAKDTREAQLGAVFFE